jgi:microcystin degradation protein MlrC
MKRVLFAGLFHETHTFVRGTTELSDFTVLLGVDILGCAGDSSPMGGALEAANALGWEIVPAIDMRASPSGKVSDAVFEWFWDRFQTTASDCAAAGVDGVFLVLHGAMVTEAIDDVEGEFLHRLRSIQGLESVPVFGVFDLHANFTRQMAMHSNCLVAYRENPHADARQSAVRAVGFLERAMSSGCVPTTNWVHPPVVWPPTGTATALDPMAGLLTLARQLEERNPGIWCVNVVAGFSFSDVPDAGVSFSVCADHSCGEGIVHAALEELASLAWSMRAHGNVRERAAALVVSEALASPVDGLTVIAEPSDNIGGGAPGDGTGLMRVFLELGLENAAVVIADAAAVERLWEWAAASKWTASRPAGRCVITVGGRFSEQDAGPVEMEVELLSLSDGRFELADKTSHLASLGGDRVEMGRCAVVRQEGLTLLLTSRATPPMDLGQWLSQGLDPSKFDFIAAKAAVAHRGAYAPIARRMLWADTPGPCSSNLESFTFHKLRRPIFPLDPMDSPAWSQFHISD